MKPKRPQSWICPPRMWPLAKALGDGNGIGRIFQETFCLLFVSVGVYFWEGLVVPLFFCK